MNTSNSVADHQTIFVINQSNSISSQSCGTNNSIIPIIKKKMEIPTKAILRRLSGNTLQLANAIELFSSSLFLNLGIKIDKTSLTTIEDIIKTDIEVKERIKEVYK